MKEINTSLLREKFVLHDPNIDLSDTKPVIALSNRILIELVNNKGDLIEIFVVRTQNMHSCVRMGARLVQSFIQGGPILNRAVEFDWETAWSSIVNDYEHSFNPDLWVSIYNNGKVIFESGNRHPLLDVIEKCDATNKGDYEDTIPIAEDAFKKTGKVLKIEYDGNVALAINLEQLEGRCGIILRGSDRTRTFNFSATATPELPLNFSQCLCVGAAFLEGIQLAFLIGMGNVKIELGMLEHNSKEEKQHKEAIKRLKRLDAEIANFENAFHVRYRPEHPRFQYTITDAEQFAMKIFKT